MKRRKNHLLIDIPTDELIEEIIHRSTFLGLVVLTKDEYLPKIKPDTPDRVSVDFETVTLLSREEQINVLDRLTFDLKKN